MEKASGFPGLIFSLLCSCSSNHRQRGSSHAGQLPQGAGLTLSFCGVSLDHFNIKPMTIVPFIGLFLFFPYGEVFSSVLLASAEE